MEISAELFFNIGNGLFLFSSYPMIKAAIKNKTSLRGYSFNGSLLTSMGMLFMIIGFLYLKSYLTAIIAIPTLTYWAIVTYYNRRHERN